MSGRLSLRGQRVAAQPSWQGGRVVLARGDGTTVELTARPLGGSEWLLEGPGGIRRVAVARCGSSIWVHAEGRAWLFEEESFAARQAHAAAGDGRLTAPMPASVLEVLAAAGDDVAEGQTLVVISAMKMQVDVKSPSAGRVLRVPVAVGDQVDAGALLVEVEVAPGEDP